MLCSFIFMPDISLLRTWNISACLKVFVRLQYKYWVLYNFLFIRGIFGGFGLGIFFKILIDISNVVIILVGSSVLIASCSRLLGPRTTNPSFSACDFHSGAQSYHSFFFPFLRCLAAALWFRKSFPFFNCNFIV